MRHIEGTASKNKSNLVRGRKENISNLLDHVLGPKGFPVFFKSPASPESQKYEKMQRNFFKGDPLKAKQEKRSL